MITKYTRQCVSSGRAVAFLVALLIGPGFLGVDQLLKGRINLSHVAVILLRVLILIPKSVNAYASTIRI
jgi:hypothetical protein